jgi:hypothetical protein
MLSLKKSSKAILLAGTVFTSILSSLGVSYAAYKLIRDTSVLCDFAQNCTLSLTPVASDGAPGLGIYRGRAVGAKPELQLSYIDPSKVSGKLELSIDGKPALSVDASVMKLQDEQLNYGDADAVAKLIEAMRNGQKLQLKFAGKVSNYSLSGFVGGLIYIDEQQSRAGTVDALQAKGAKSAPPAPDVTLIKDVQQIPEQVRKDFTDEDGVCGTSNGDSFSSGGGFNAKIADGLNLIGMPCGSPGAYNQSYVFYSRARIRSFQFRCRPFQMLDQAQRTRPGILIGRSRIKRSQRSSRAGDWVIAASMTSGKRMTTGRARFALCSLKNARKVIATAIMRAAPKSGQRAGLHPQNSCGFGYN